MLKKWFESLPFVHHQPPLNLPLRKAVVMSLQRPVNLLEIQKYLLKQFQKMAIELLRRLFQQFNT